MPSSLDGDTVPAGARGNGEDAEGWRSPGRDAQRYGAPKPGHVGLGDEGTSVLYWFLKWTLGASLRLVFRPKVVGLENVPTHGGAILASNHLSFSDSFFAPLVIPGRKVTFMAKAEYFNQSGLKGTLSRWFFRGIGQLSVDRSGGKASASGLRTGLEVLQSGELLGIYPEGTRSPDGKLYRGRTGVARIVLEAGVPVIPCAMVNTDRVQPPGQLVPKVVRPEVRFGKPLDFSRYTGMETDRLVLRAITDEIMYELMRLSGQQYVDIYATKAKEQIQQQRHRGKRDDGHDQKPAPPA
jgi:1-acyl-sn-glycerol-3-phosphate acyltransferase